MSVFFALALGPAISRAERSLSKYDNITDELRDITRVQDPILVHTNVNKWCEEILDDIVVPADIVVTQELRTSTNVEMGQWN